MELQYKNEKTTFTILAILAGLFWLALIVGTFGLGLVYVLFFFVFYLFAQSGFIAHLKGSAVEVTPQQYPDLHERFVRCCETLGITERPHLYLQNSDGMLNALATRFLGNDYVVLYSRVVDALHDDPDAIDFYIGHELGHIRLKHLTRGWLLIPSSWLPLIGTAWRRAREYSCDLHGSACCANEQSAVNAIALLAAGETRWQALDRRQWLHQVKATGGFWMSFHEFTNDYPWLTKRLAHLLRVRGSESVEAPSRHPFAAFLAIFVPRFGTGGPAGLLVLVAIIGILAAVAIPAYQDYIKVAELAKEQAAAEAAAAAGMAGMGSDEEAAPADEMPADEPASADGTLPDTDNWHELYAALEQSGADPQAQENARQQFFLQHVVPDLAPEADVREAYATFAGEHLLPHEEQQ